MAVLTEEMKAHLIQQLACYITPSNAAESLRGAYGVEISRQQAHRYDPDGNQGHKLAPRWAALHAETRTQFLKRIADIPIADRVVRIKWLNDLFEQLVDEGNLPQAARILEQAAKEIGHRGGRS